MSDLPSHLPLLHLPPAHHPTYHTLLTTTLTTTDLLTLPPLTISRLVPSLSLLTLRSFLSLLPSLLLPSLSPPSVPSSTGDPSPSSFTTLPSPLPSLPAIPLGRIVDIPGPASAGKTQLLLAYTASAVTAGHAVAWITTESSGLPTSRLVDLGVDLSRVFCIACNDLETQLHVMSYQLPVLISRHRIRLLVLDSAAGNFRDGGAPGGESRGKGLARRGGELVKMVRGLREVAVKEGVVILCANQVSDRFEGGERGDRRMLDEQMRWFGGWEGGEKVPALGLVWAGLLGGRFVVKREGGRGVRTVRVVWADWAEAGGEVRFVVEREGVRELAEGEEMEGTDGWRLSGEVEEGGLD